jgi:hypothetical protein
VAEPPFTRSRPGRTWLEPVGAGQRLPSRARLGSARLEPVKLRGAAWLALVALAVGCGGGSDAVRESLADVDPSGGYWAIRATCEGGRFEVDFRPERLSVPGLGHASQDEIAVECGDPERVAVSNEDLRNRTPTGAELTRPTSEPAEISCVADGSIVVEAHPVWGSEGVVGAALRVERGGLTIVDGAIVKGHDPPAELFWWRALCRRS